MSGRYEQLGRQLRKVRSALAKHEAKPLAVALRRATHLAIDLVLEQVETDDAAAGIREISSRGIVEPTLAERLATAFSAEEDRNREPDEGEVIARGGDVDRLLRSLEHGAPMPELPFTPLDIVEVPPVESRAAVTVSGRQVIVAGRGGEGLVFIDDRAVGRPFPMPTAPQSKASVSRELSGQTRITWETEGVVVELGADLASASALLPD